MSDSSGSVDPPSRATGASREASTARVTLSTEGFALAPLFERLPDARVTLEPAVANPADHALLVVHAVDNEQAVESALYADPAIGAAEAFSTHDDALRYRVTWDGRPHRLVRRLVAEGVILLHASAHSNRWRVRLLALDRGTISRGFEVFEDLGCDHDCQSVTTFDGGHSGLREMSDEQHETLVTAFEMGYYDIPRNTTSGELADHLGISHQALSERFRRAHKRLVESELIVQ